jgi:hypothetical protein
MFLKNNVTDYSKLDKDLQERKASGAYPNTEFVVGDLMEHTVNATDLSKKSDDVPFPAANEGNPWGGF